MGDYHYPIPSREIESRAAVGSGEVKEYTLTAEQLKQFNESLPAPDRVQAKQSPPISLQRKTRPDKPEEPIIQPAQPTQPIQPEQRKRGAKTKYDHITKEMVLEEFDRGLTIRQIERKYNMGQNTLYGKLKAWGLRSPKSDKFSKAENNRKAEGNQDRRPMDMKIDDITTDVVLELRRAMGRTAPLTSAHEGYAVLMSEVDQAWEAIKGNDLLKARLKMQQVAAMALRYLYDIPIAR
ncbi:hypothetical protein [Paenibacillus sanguinis]|uniref:hypothetical protein n=1 Tax=Paenibacillus sanguinis TaxID=225906 RepID=UPI000381DD78|nr:hypothetical protein [Paenibacillus sanguinis]